jgi:hypothetical protein
MPATTSPSETAIAANHNLSTALLHPSTASPLNSATAKMPLSYNLPLSPLTSAMTDDFEIDHKSENAKGGFSTGIKFLTGKGVSMYNCKLLYIYTVVNILLFGCETWAIKEPQFTKLEAFHTKHLRKLLGINMRHV